MEKARFLVAVMALAAMLFSGCSKGEGDKVPVDRIEVSLTEQVLLPGQGQQLTATVIPANATDKAVTWSSSNTRVASVDPKSGWVMGVSPGYAIITASAHSGGQTDDCEITVIPEESEVLDAITDPAFKAYAVYCMHHAQEGFDMDGNTVTYPKWDTNGDGILSPGEAAAVTYIDVSGGYQEKAVASLAGLGYFTGLIRLDCSFNGLTALNVDVNTVLEGLFCDGNELAVLDVSHNTALVALSCGANHLTAFDVTNNANLVALYVNRNQLSELDVSKNSALTVLDCSVNQLTVLDVSANPALSSLVCHNNKLSALDASKMAFFAGTSQYTVLCGGQTALGSSDPQPLTLTLRADQKLHWDSSLKNNDANKGVTLSN